MSTAFSQRDCWCILGLPFDAITLEQAVNQLLKVIDDKDGCFLSTPNLNFVIAAQSDNAFFESVVDSDLSIADGMPLIWVAKLLSVPVTERVAGSSLFEALMMQEGLARRIKVFFFGGQQGVAELAHQKLNETSSAMKSCGFYDPGFVTVDKMSDATIINYINSCEPDFIVVALGARKGQEWIQKNKDRLNAPVISHLGAVINFVTGNVKRAPVLWQRLGMEWLWRIRQEPSLWRRYLFDGLAFIQLIAMNVLPLAVYDRFLRKTASYHIPCDVILEQQEACTIGLAGSIHHASMDSVRQYYAKVIAEYTDDVVIDCEQLVYIDSAFIATSLLFQRYLNEQGRLLVLRNVSSRIERLLRLSSVGERFTLS